MNLINDLTKIRIIFFITVLYGFSTNNVSSGYTYPFFPLVNSYLSSLTGNKLTLHDVIFDNEGLIYLAAENSIIITNGVGEQYLSLKEKVSFTAGDNNIFFYSESDAGFIYPDSSGNFKFRSFEYLFNDHYDPFTNISDLHVKGDEVYISANSKLYLLKNNKISVADSSFENGRMFMAGRTLLVHKPGIGIKRVANNCQNEEYKFTGNFMPDWILEHHNGFLAYSLKENRFVVFSEDLNQMEKWTPFFERPVLLATQSDEKYFFYTNDNQVIITTEDGIPDHFFKENAISPVFNVNKIKIKDNKLWFLQNKQLSFLEFPPAIIKSSFTNLSGIINSIIAKKDTYYFSNSEGLHYFNVKEGEMVKIISHQVISLENIADFIVAHTDNGLWIIHDKAVYEVYQGNVRAYAYDKTNDVLYYSIPGKILSQKINVSKLPESEVFLEGVDATILFFDNSELWYSDGYNIGSLESLNNSVKCPGYFYSSRERILNIFNFNRTILYLTESGIFENHDKTFVSIISSGQIAKGNTFFNTAHCGEHDLWLNMRDNKGNYLLFYSANLKDFFQINFHLFNAAYPAAVTLKSGNNYIISSGDRIFSYNFNIEPVLSVKNHNIFLNKIIAGNDTVFCGLSITPFLAFFDTPLKNISYSRRNLKLEVSTNEYVSSPVLYRYEIKGRQNYSSDWSNSTEIQFPNLKQGTHKIIIHSYCPSSNSLGNASLTVQILTPMFKKWWAVIIYILLSLSILFVIYKILIYRYLRTPPALQDSPVSVMITKDAPKTQIFTEQVKPIPADKSKWEKFEMATVLFSDIQGFTKIAEQMNPEMLIDELDKFFFHFDSVCEKYDIEKIKTIGDAYMAAGGIPRQNSTNPIEIVLAALEMQNFMKQLKNYRIDIWDLRIGIHSGPVIGGIIGHKKRSYDIWGDTVNTASRMESSGEPGKVNISGVTYSLIKEYFICEYRGKLPVKYKGNIDMYFVKGLRPELSVNLGTLPNRIFFLKMQHLRLRDLEKFVFYKLESELSKNLYFHNFEYIKHLYIHANLLSRAENLTVEEDLIIKTTIILLYTGLITSYENFQNKSADYAELILQEYKYSKKQIIAVYNLILFAKMQHQPLSQSECIIHDVLTEFYGRADYTHIYKLFFLEQNENIGNLTVSNWKEQQIKALRAHKFYTRSAISLREVSAEQQINNIETDEWE